MPYRDIHGDALADQGGHRRPGATQVGTGELGTLGGAWAPWSLCPALPTGPLPDGHGGQGYSRYGVVMNALTSHVTSLPRDVIASGP